MPIEVWTTSDLDNVRNNLSGEYIQMADIDLSGWGNWTAISSGFSGTYDGGNFSILNLTCSDLNTSFPFPGVGLFAYLNSATLKNINIVNANITGQRYTGVLAGFSLYSTIENCRVEGSINCLHSNAGGILGGSDWDNITSCSSQVSITASRYSVGGLVGLAYYINLSKCYSNFTIESSNINFSECGGLVGGLHGAGSASNCYAKGSISVPISNPFGIGGFAGYVTNMIITNSYAATSLNFSSGFDPSYASGFAYLGNGNTLNNCYYDSDVSGFSDTSGGVNPKTTAEMKDINTFLPEWDFETIWGIDGITNEGYPFLGAAVIKAINIWVNKVNQFRRTEGLPPKIGGKFMEYVNCWVKKGDRFYPV